MTRALITGEQDAREQMTYEEFLTLTDEDTYAEWVQGEAAFYKPRDTRHQNLLGFWLTVLSNYVSLFRLGNVLFIPFEMKLVAQNSSRQPDLLLVANEHIHRITCKRLEGPADLVIEIISDDSVARDRDEKFYEYQAAGIPEYWILDPRPGRQRADFYVLSPKGQYRAVPLNEDDVYYSTVIPGFWLDVNWLWQEELPDPIRTLAALSAPTS
jgi:Uma2 family endonuclease